MRHFFQGFGFALCLVIFAIAPASAQQIDRTQLPIPDKQYKYPGKVPLDARDAKFPPIKPLRPPEGAPNVVVILLDDIGFGAPSTFGGGVNMPTFDALAKEGLRYTQFHTTALCSPTRAGAAHRPQPSFGRDGIDYRTGDQRSGKHRDAA